MPVSPYFKSLSAKVAVPGEDDPVDVRQVGENTYMDFGIDSGANIGAARSYARQMDGRRPLTQREIGADALLRAQLGVPDQTLDFLQYGPATTPGLEPLEMPFSDIKKRNLSRPQQSYGLNRGGTGKAGRVKSPQLGNTQFDMPGLEPFEMLQSELDDKPWELDQNTNADVAPGTTTTPKADENVVDKEPDLQTPRGLYQALAKKYPDILQQNFDQLQQSRVSMDDVDALRDRSGLGSLFIAASKAASGAGSVGGKTAESIAPGIVEREDTLARQRLKDRMDVASENLSMNAKAVDLAMKQINFADEREQYDPNSEVSRFARDFMKSEFDVNVPDNVPAYQLKQFLPAVVQKYQAAERAKYQSALLGQKTEENLLNDAYKRYQVATQSGDKQAQIKAQKEIASIRAMAKAPGAAKTPKPEKPVLTEAEKIRNELVKDDAKAYQKRLRGIQKLDGALKALDEAKTAGEIVHIGQGLLKTLNDTENSDAVGAEEVRRLALELEPFAVMTAKQVIQVGRDLTGFVERVRNARKVLYETAKKQYDTINTKMPGVVDAPPTYGTQSETLPSGNKPLTPEERKKMEDLQKRKRGGQ